MSTAGRDPDEPGTDVDAVFAEIVAGWDRTDAPAAWPEAEDADSTDKADGADKAEETNEPATAEVDQLDDEGHFVPPEPPPLPRPQPQTIGAIALFGIGLVLLLAPRLLGFSTKYGLLLGLLAISGGIVWLIARLRQGPPTDSGWDDGAQV